MKRATSAPASARRTMLLACAASATVCALCAPARAQVGRVSFPMAEQGELATRDTRRAGRLSLGLDGGVTVEDQLAQTMLLGLEVGGGVTEWLGFSVWGQLGNLGNAFRLDSDFVTQVDAAPGTTSGGTPSVPNAARFGDQITRVVGLIGTHATVAPIRFELADGEVGLDPELLVGVAAGILEERAHCATEERCARLERQVRVTPGPVLGGALRAYLGERVALSATYRAVGLTTNLSGTDEGGPSEGGSSGGGSFPDGRIDARDRSLVWHHALTLGVHVLLPVAP